MSTAIQTRQSTQIAEIERNAIEIRVALNQNLWGMPDDQVWKYYVMMCHHMRVDPASKPFDIITDAKQQQKKLYPNTSCTSQLGENARLSYGRLDIYVNQAMVALGFKVAHVSLEVRHPNGRTLVSEAFVDLMSGWEGKALSGNNLVNALKKAGTQCRRRGTLQMLGLAAPSEEIPTVKLGDLERAEGDIDGVVIEYPPAAALQSAPIRHLTKAEQQAADNFEDPPSVAMQNRNNAAAAKAERRGPAISEFTEEERAIYEAAREEELGESAIEATQEEFWETAQFHGVSSRDAAPLAKRASMGEISWSDAIKQLPKK